MSNRRYRPRSVVHRYIQDKEKFLRNNNIRDFGIMVFKIRENLRLEGGQSEWAKKNTKILREISHELEIIILEETILN